MWKLPILHKNLVFRDTVGNLMQRFLAQSFYVYKELIVKTWKRWHLIRFVLSYLGMPINVFFCQSKIRNGILPLFVIFILKDPSAHHYKIFRTPSTTLISPWLTVIMCTSLFKSNRVFFARSKLVPKFTITICDYVSFIVRCFGMSR